MKKLSILPLIVFAFVAFISCDAQTKKKTTTNTAKTSVENIISVAVNFSAGRAGFYELKATPDSITTESAGGIMSPKYPNSKKAITAEQWKNLISELDTKAIAMIKSGENTGMYDGPQDVFTIVTKNATYTIINPDKAEGKQLYSLKTKLESLRSTGLRK